MLYVYTTVASKVSAKSYSIVSHCATTGCPLRFRGQLTWKWPTWPFQSTELLKALLWGSWGYLWKGGRESINFQALRRWSLVHSTRDGLAICLSGEKKDPNFPISFVPLHRSHLVIYKPAFQQYLLSANIWRGCREQIERRPSTSSCLSVQMPHTRPVGRYYFLLLTWFVLFQPLKHQPYAILAVITIFTQEGTYYHLFMSLPSQIPLLLPFSRKARKEAPGDPWILIQALEANPTTRSQY